MTQVKIEVNWDRPEGCLRLEAHTDPDLIQSKMRLEAVTGLNYPRKITVGNNLMGELCARLLNATQLFKQI